MIRYAVDVVMQAFAEQMILDVVNRHPRGPISMSSPKLPLTDNRSQLKKNKRTSENFQAVSVCF